MGRKDTKAASAKESSKKTLSGCNSPEGCLVGTPLSVGDGVDVVGVVCSESSCTQIPLLHRKCFERWEKQLIKELDKLRYTRHWSENEMQKNLWDGSRNHNVYQYVYRSCQCRCGGYLTKQFDQNQQDHSKVAVGKKVLPTLASNVTRGLKQRNPTLTMKVNVKSQAVTLGERYRERNDNDDGPKYPIGMKPPVEQMKKSVRVRSKSGSFDWNKKQNNDSPTHTSSIDTGSIKTQSHHQLEQSDDDSEGWEKVGPSRRNKQIVYQPNVAPSGRSPRKQQNGRLSNDRTSRNSSGSRSRSVSLGRYSIKQQSPEPLHLEKLSSKSQFAWVRDVNGDHCHPNVSQSQKSPSPVMSDVDFGENLDNELDLLKTERKEEKDTDSLVSEWSNLASPNQACSYSIPVPKMQETVPVVVQHTNQPHSNGQHTVHMRNYGFLPHLSQQNATEPQIPKFVFNPVEMPVSNIVSPLETHLHISDWMINDLYDSVPIQLNLLNAFIQSQ